MSIQTLPVHDVLNSVSTHTSQNLFVRERGIITFVF